MVRLQVSLLIVTLAAGSALASSADYQRRSELDVDDQLQSRGFESEEDLVVRQPPVLHLRFGLATARNSFQSRALEENEELFGRDPSDDLEVREPISVGTLAKMERRVHPHAKSLNHVAKYANRFYEGEQFVSSFQGRSLEDDEELFGRDLDAVYVLEVREPISVGALAKMERRVHPHTKSLNHVAKYANGFYEGQQFASSFQGRSLEDEGLFERDLDAEEFFEREYDFLDERDIFDDLD